MARLMDIGLCYIGPFGNFRITPNTFIIEEPHKELVFWHYGRVEYAFP
jgi:hypothetical protein